MVGVGGGGVYSGDCGLLFGGCSGVVWVRVI